MSENVRLIMTSIFATSFVNTGVILLLTNADLSYSPLSFIPINNQYSDLNQDWYLDIGPGLIKTMGIMAFYPYIEIMIFGGIKAIQ